MDSIFSVFDKMLQVTQSFGPEEWAVISVITVSFGYFCLKGMNIR